MSFKRLSDLNGDEFFVSDINVENDEELDALDNDDEPIKAMRIEIVDTCSSSSESKELQVDDDGDLVINRRPRELGALLIKYHKRTLLDDVGFQLWRASFYLCDFILSNRELLQDEHVVELGAGLGLASMLASLHARRVICTDLKRVVEAAEANFLSNLSNLAQLSCGQADSSLLKTKVEFKELNWLEHEKLADDEDALSNATVFLAADVIYDDVLTIHFLKTLYKLMAASQHQPKVAFIANEKRINFYTDELTVKAAAYSYFVQSLQELDGYVDSEHSVKFSVKQEEVAPQKWIASYKRNDHLTIWQIKSESC